MNLAASPEMKAYLEEIEARTNDTYRIAQAAREKGFDPEKKVDIPIARNMAERVEGIISATAPELVGTAMTPRILELEKQYGAGAWEVALLIAKEVAEEKFCAFSDKRKAMEVGIRTGMAYSTAGIVAAPLEGFIELRLKKRKDGKEYFSVFYAGPIRGAGGTAASVSVLIADYVRKQMGYAPFDPSEEEVKRYVTEVRDYHERITNLQYFPSEQEIDYLVRRIPVEINGDPTEQMEVSNYKDLPRVETNRIRGGVCLVLAEGIAQKSPKLWKRLQKWGKDFSLDWDFLKDFLELQKSIKAGKKEQKQEEKNVLTPNYVYIKDLVAGRPVLTHPMRPGGFRLRMGRTRTSGFSAAAIHPATQIILDSYIAIGTQLKVERPGKAAAITVCDTIEGPVVKLKNGDVIRLFSTSDAKACNKEVEKILFMGDILYNYGDFSENGHLLVPVGYCEEWYLHDVVAACKTVLGIDFPEKKQGRVMAPEETCQKISVHTAVAAIDVCSFFENCLLFRPSPAMALSFSKHLGVPLHPLHTWHWGILTADECIRLCHWLSSGKRHTTQTGAVEKIILTLKPDEKCLLEKIGMPHQQTPDHVVIETQQADILIGLFSFDESFSARLASVQPAGTGLDVVNLLSPIKIKDKSGTFIGARMGRPEKSKMRQLTGSPHLLFPVGDEGGRLRSFQAAMETKKVTGQFPFFMCVACGKETIYRCCERCGQPTKQLYFCKECGPKEKPSCPAHGPCTSFYQRDIDINHFFQSAIRRLGLSSYPDLIKGVRGTSNKDHLPEHLAKGILRAKHDVYVNKDGTTRYDMSELPLTHFKPCEIETSVPLLKKMGYALDIFGAPLVLDDQILELKPQDVILPCGGDTMELPGDEVLFRIANFVDELLEKFYGLPAFYKLQRPRDIVGHLVIGLAPHISAGIVGRIIGFSKIQGLYAHPLYHAAMRRDCFTYDTYLPIFDGQCWKNMPLGKLVESLNPQKIVDSFGTKEVRVSNYSTLGLGANGHVSIVPISCFTKHRPRRILKIKTSTGRELSVTEDHKFLVKDGNALKIKRASELIPTDILPLPKKISFPQHSPTHFYLIDIFRGREDVMVHRIKAILKKYLCDGPTKISQKTGRPLRDVRNFFHRDSFPVTFLESVCTRYHLNIFHLAKRAQFSGKRDHVFLPSTLRLSPSFMEYLGLYVAEGYSRYVRSGKGVAQVYIAGFDRAIRKKIISFGKSIGLRQSENKDDRVTFCSRLWYEIITTFFGCGSTAYEKRVPPFLFQADKKLVGGFLRGYFEGDGSVSLSDIRISCDSVSKALLNDIHLLLLKYGIFSRFFEYSKQPGPRVRAFYIKKNRTIPIFSITKLTIPSNFVSLYWREINFMSKKKKNILRILSTKHSPLGMRLSEDKNYYYDPIQEIHALEKEETTYCLTVENNVVLANGILTNQCDGDEACVILLMDALLNFSRQFLPDARGSRTMDSPLVLTVRLVPSEVDDMVLGLDTVWSYPPALYDACLQLKKTGEVDVEQLRKRLDTPLQYEGIGYTHPITNINDGVRVSAYKTLPSMEEKLRGQMALAEKIVAVDEADVATRVIEKHFIRDIRGNLRKFSMQEFRCVKCNEKFRRPPLIGKCTVCKGNLLFTISEGSIVKYLEPSLSLARKYAVPVYVRQNLELTKRRIEEVFGRDKEKQSGLGAWFG